MKYIKTITTVLLFSAIPFMAYSYPVTEKGKSADTWKVNAKETKVNFTIVSNSAGKVTGSFPGGVQGWLTLNQKNSHGSFNIKLDTLQSVNKEGKPNPVRDTNVKESFFGIRDSSVSKDGVNAVWNEIGDKLEKGVSQAIFSIDGVKNLKQGKDSGTATVTGKATFWGLINIDLNFPVTAKMDNDTLTITSTSPATFNLESVLGKPLRDLAFKTLLAAGCPHEKGIQNDINITLEKVVLRKEK